MKYFDNYCLARDVLLPDWQNEIVDPDILSIRFCKRSQMEKKKAFGLWSAVFLGVGAMVGVGIFIVIGEAGAIVGTMVLYTFVLGGLIAM